jgi:endoglucanase
MKNLIIIFIVAFIFGCQTPTPEITEEIKVNSLGFLPDAPKQASLTIAAETFIVRNASNGKRVFKGKPSAAVKQEDVDQEVWTVDFSSVTKPGNYYVEIPEVGRSVEFPIGKQVYNDAYVTSMRAFYLWRCGMEVSGEHNGNHFHQGVCHLNDGYEDYIGNPGNRRDGTGGWHDAGDYGKYTVNAGVTVGIMFMAWEHFQPQLEKTALNLPETAPGFPEYLKEMKWETDWLLKMPYPDGSGRVSHKLTRLNFAGFIMADQDDGQRYFTEWSSAATADFVAMMAQAARVFKPYDAEYAQKCLDAARLSYNFLKVNPEEKRFVQGDFRTGGYQTRDADDKLWAAAEMWETTGEAEFLADFEQRAADMQFNVDENWDWGNVANLGMFTYAMSKKSGKSPEAEAAIKRNILKIADQIVEQAQADVYRRPLAGRYYWGCNGTIARQTVNLYVANLLSPRKEYAETALDAIGHIFGRNYYNRSYVTGIGINPPMFPHDRRSGADGIEDPWPGYIVGGGHKATDWVDEEGSYSHNEVAINWQAPLVFALAWFLNP